MLDRLRVLDLTRNLAGPYCTMLLADLGADVVKIEQPGTGDDTRSWAPPRWGDESATFLAANRNKRSLVLDLDTPGGSRDREASRPSVRRPRRELQARVTGQAAGSDTKH